MVIRKENAYQYALCMDLTPDKFQFSIVDPQKKEILHFEEHLLENYTKETLQGLLENEILTFSYKSFSLAAGTFRNTLIPIDLFNYSKPIDVFRLNYPEPIDNLDYNRIPELGIVNVYEFPLWIKSVFIIKFPRVKLVHRSTVILKGVFDQPTYSPKIHLTVEKNQFYLLLTDRSKLIYFNRFDYKELADIVYYILFVLDQKELDQSKFDLWVYGVSKKWSEKANFQSFFTSKVTIADKKEKAEHFILAKQLLCV